MTDNNMLSQEEIDALLRGGGDSAAEGKKTADENEPLSEVEQQQDEENAEQQADETQSPQDDVVDGGKDIENTEETKTESPPETPDVGDTKVAKPSDSVGSVLSQQEKDALGEVGNITMGSGSTALSELLNQRVVITSPRVELMSRHEFFGNFEVPNVVIQVDFNAGLTGYNILVIKMNDAVVMADLMMGGTGEVEADENIGEIELSAASEAMNQMIGSASTSLSSMFSMPINISPPITNIWDVGKEYNLPIDDEEIVLVSFDMKIGDLLDTEIMQVMSVKTAKSQVELMMKNLLGESAEVAASEAVSEPQITDAPSRDSQQSKAEPERPKETREVKEEEDDWLNSDFWSEKEQKQSTAQAAPIAQQQMKPSAQEGPSVELSAEEKKKLELLLDVPLKVSVVLGRTKRPIKEVLALTPGAIVELSSIVDEPVEILINGTLVARGEVVVVNENFGVRITYILSTKERLMKLK